jgi:hypothetical protein
LHSLRTDNAPGLSRVKVRSLRTGHTFIAVPNRLRGRACYTGLVVLVGRWGAEAFQRNTIEKIALRTANALESGRIVMGVERALLTRKR